MTYPNYLPIIYSGFWDVPHAFFTVYEDKTYFFRRGYFDEEIDDYPPNYKIYLVENMSLEEAIEPCDPPHQSVILTDIPKLEANELVGELPTKDVVFDETNRRFVNVSVFKMLGIG